MKILRPLVLFGVCLWAIGSHPTIAIAQPAGTNVALIDIIEVFKNHPGYKDRMEAWRKEKEKLDDFLRSQNQKLATDLEKLKSFNAGTKEFKEAEREFANAQADLQVQVQLRRNSLIEAQAKIHFEAYQEVKAVVDRFAARNGIALVLRFDSAPMDPLKPETVPEGVNRPIVYQSGLDITEQIVELLAQSQPARPVANGRPPAAGPQPSGGNRKPPKDTSGGTTIGTRPGSTGKKQ